MDMGSADGTTSDLDRLIADARGGSAVAFRRLLELLSDHLWAELGPRRKARNLGPSHGLSDLIQDTLARVGEKFAKFERDTFAEFTQWARTILYRRGQEWARNYRWRNDAARTEKIGLALRDRIESARHGSRQENIPQEREEAARVYAKFQCLQPHEQFIINLRVVEGLRYPQIEALTGWTKEAARQAYRRAIERLRKLLKSDVQQ